MQKYHIIITFTLLCIIALVESHSSSIGINEYPYPYSVSNQSLHIIPDQLKSDYVVMNDLAAQSFPITDENIRVVFEDEQYLNSILQLVFPQGTENKDPEVISIEIEKYVASMLVLKDNSGNATKMLKEGYAICGGFSFIMETLLKEVGIPTRYVNIYGLQDQGAHTLVEVFYNGQWHLFDPTFGLFFYSEKTYNNTGVIPSLSDIMADPTHPWYIYKVVMMPFTKKYDSSVQNYHPEIIEDSYLDVIYGKDYDFPKKYYDMFNYSFPIAYNNHQVISFPVVVNLTLNTNQTIGNLDGNYSDVVSVTAGTSSAGKSGS